jgi:hypothetical protein
MMEKQHPSVKTQAAENKEATRIDTKPGISLPLAKPLLTNRESLSPGYRNYWLTIERSSSVNGKSELQPTPVQILSRDRSMPSKDSIPRSA